ncbi:MAG: DUF4260 domain-containing protein [Candidatus Acidiferrales bacterium]
MPTRPGLILRVEAAVVLVLSVALYRHAGGGWLRFALLFLVPDLSLAGYAFSVRFGTALYNTVHTYTGPLVLAGIAIFGARPVMLLYALIWTAHIGMDRLVGFGLKYPTRFQDTHLQHV